MSDTDSDSHHTGTGSQADNAGSQHKKIIELLSSEQAALTDFSAATVVEGNCVECNCEVFLFYHYDDGSRCRKRPLF